MIRCDNCLRANPPTRMSCLYCAATLPANEASKHLRRPTLLTPDKLDPGYNAILVAQDQTRDTLSQTAELLKVPPDELAKILSANQSLPLARTATYEEAQLLTARLNELGIDTNVVSDEELGITENNLTRVRSISFEVATLSVSTSHCGESVELKYADLILLIRARLITKRTTVTERASRGLENQIIDASEFYADESVIDFYSCAYPQTFRITANSFDFSCLGNRKALLVNENTGSLVDLIQSHAGQIEIDNSYNGVRQMLELVWGAEKVTKSEGWKRGGPGRFTVGATTTLSNENQFTRYSRLRYFYRQRKS